jgi:hypothetical protein
MSLNRRGNPAAECKRIFRDVLTDEERRLQSEELRREDEREKSGDCWDVIGELLDLIAGIFA